MTSRQAPVWADVPTRLLTIAIGAPVILGAVFWGTPLFQIVTIIIGLLAAVELWQMIAHDHPTAWFLAQLVAFCCMFAGVVSSSLLVLAAIVGGAAVCLWAYSTHDPQTLWRYLSLLIGTLYISIPLGFLIAIRALDNGFVWIFVLFAANWGTDSFALVGGRLFGRRKLAPHISANKTVEGALFGFVCGVLAGVLIGLVASAPVAFVVSAPPIIAVLTIAGDLIESQAKRILGVKDTSRLLPGHGGIIDRIDGLVLATPVYYFMLLFVLPLLVH
ncbi:MAG: phosphatidate cytidylyltransferase [bacterium]|nr:phosphatidate cytidylyltransferase [bacterium]